MVAEPKALPDDLDALKAALLAERVGRLDEAARTARVEAELAVAKARASDDQAMIAHQKLQILKLTRQLYGQRSERSVRLLDQMEMALEELESSATEDEIAAENTVVSNDIGNAPLGDTNPPPSFPHARFVCGSASAPGLSSPERRFSRSR